MPARFSMSWEPRQRLWRKMYKGHCCTVSCKQLSSWAGNPVPETKEGSYQTANAWWQARKAAIDDQQPPHPNADYLSSLNRRRDWARQHGDMPIASFIGTEIARIESGGKPYEFGRSYSSFDYDIYNRLEATGTKLSGALESISPIDEVWNDRIERDDPKPIPEERSFGGLVKRYLDLELGRVEADALSPSEYDLARLCLESFRDWAGAEANVDRLNADTWEDWWRHLMSWSGSSEYKKKRYRHARNFVDWLVSKGVIAIPPNLHNRRYRFGSSIRAIPTMTIAEVRRLVDNATGQLRLHLMLMVNCGMQQTDISDLLQDDVDWSEGRITRKRSKTGDNENVPKVSYKLWPLTWKLLQEYRSQDGKHVLLTKSRGRWVEDRIDGGKRHKVDNIATNYAHLKAKLNRGKTDSESFTKPLKLIRKTSATLIESNENFGRYKGHFLGHSPRTIAEINYAAPSPVLFDRIMLWLGQQYGYIPQE